MGLLPRLVNGASEQMTTGVEVLLSQQKQKACSVPNVVIYNLAPIIPGSFVSCELNENTLFIFTGKHDNPDLESLPRTQYLFPRLNENVGRMKNG